MSLSYDGSEICHTCGFFFPPGSDAHVCPLDGIKPVFDGSQQMGIAILEGVRFLLHTEAQKEQMRRLTESGFPDPNLDEEGRLGGSSSCRTRPAVLSTNGSVDLLAITSLSSLSTSSLTKHTSMPAPPVTPKSPRKYMSPIPPVWPDKHSAETWSANGTPRSLISRAEEAEKLKVNYNNPHINISSNTMWPPLPQNSPAVSCNCPVVQLPDAARCSTLNVVCRPGEQMLKFTEGSQVGKAFIENY